jgi:hypothetical protein
MTNQDCLLFSLLATVNVVRVKFLAMYRVDKTKCHKFFHGIMIK